MKRTNHRSMLAAGLLLIACGIVVLCLSVPVMRDWEQAEGFAGVFLLLPRLILTPLLVFLIAGPVLGGSILTVRAAFALRDERRARRAEEQQADDVLKELTQNGALTPEEYDELTNRKS